MTKISILRIAGRLFSWLQLDSPVKELGDSNVESVMIWCHHNPVIFVTESNGGYNTRLHTEQHTKIVMIFTVSCYCDDLWSTSPNTDYYIYR